MAGALCAQCEKSQGKIVCLDEGLKYCNTCSAELHRRRARRHHQLRVVQPAPTCDECEEALASVECCDCGGKVEPLLFCPGCSRSLHSRVARFHHVLKPFPHIASDEVTAGGPTNEQTTQKSNRRFGCEDSSQNMPRKVREETQKLKPSIRHLKSLVKTEPAEMARQSIVQPVSGVQTERNAGNGTLPGLVKTELADDSLNPGSWNPSEAGKNNLQHGERRPRRGAVDNERFGTVKRTQSAGADAARASNGTGNVQEKTDIGCQPGPKISRKRDRDNMQTGSPLRQRLCEVTSSEFNGEKNGISQANCMAKHVASRMSGKENKNGVQGDGPKGRKENSEDGQRSPKAGSSDKTRPLHPPSPLHYSNDISEEEYFSVEDEDATETSASSEDCGIHRIKRGSVTLEAYVVNADLEDDAENASQGEEREETGGAGVKERIKKMLKLGLHPDTPELEAQQALKNAQRLLTKHNLQQAEVMKGTLKDPTVLVGGMRVVELKGKGRTKVGRFERWIKDLASVIADNFDVQYFTRGARGASGALQVVFYGISHNADCAGYAFAATFNRVTKMSADYTDPESENKCDVSSQRSVNTRIARMSYRDGVVEGLRQFVKLAQEQRKAGCSFNNRGNDQGKQHQDTADRCLSGDECDYFSGEDSILNPPDGSSDFSTFEKPQKGGHPNVKNEASLAQKHKTDEKRAERGMAICALVVHSQKVGDDFLKEKGIKLTFKSVKKTRTFVNVEAYSQGKKDSKQIDINQRALGSEARAKRRTRKQEL